MLRKSLAALLIAFLLVGFFTVQNVSASSTFSEMESANLGQGIVKRDSGGYTVTQENGEVIIPAQQFDSVDNKCGIIVEIETHPELLIIHWKSGEAEDIKTTVRKEYIRKITKKEAISIIKKGG